MLVFKIMTKCYSNKIMKFILFYSNNGILTLILSIIHTVCINEYTTCLHPGFLCIYMCTKMYTVSQDLILFGEKAFHFTTDLKSAA